MRMFLKFSNIYSHFEYHNSASFILYSFRTNIFDGSEVPVKIRDEVEQLNPTTDSIITNTDTTTMTNSN